MYSGGNRLVVVSTVVALVLLTATTAVAVQDRRSIAVNEPATGTIDSTDPSNPDFRGYYEPVTFSGEARQLVTVTMRAADDTALYLLDPSGRLVASDVGRGHWSELLRELQTTGPYTVVAASVDRDGTFAYELTVAVPRERSIHSTGCTDAGNVDGVTDSATVLDEGSGGACSLKTVRTTTC